MNTAKKLHILFLAGLIIWLMGALSLSIYYFDMYRDYSWVVDDDPLIYYHVMCGIVTSGMVILFLSVGLALLLVRDAMVSRSKLGFAVIISGLAVLLAHFAVNLTQPWRPSEVTFWVPLRSALWTMSFYLIGAGVGISVFGSILPRDTRIEAMAEAEV